LALFGLSVTLKSDPATAEGLVFGRQFRETLALWAGD
jgi:hypothetical protein